MRFTEEELLLAKQVDLCAVASHLGYTVKRIGKYHTLKEMDSIRIYNRTNWFRWSKQYDVGENGGSQIDFLRVFAGMDVKHAVFWLLDFAGYQRDGLSKEKMQKDMLVTKQKAEVPKLFILPEFAGSNAYLYRYLTVERRIEKLVVDELVQAGLLYEEKHYHNIVFVGKDKSGTPRFASMRGVFDKNGKGFKCDVAENDKHYGFNIVRKNSHKVVVFEAAIDLMSYMTLYSTEQNNMLALGMLGDAPLETFLKEHEQVNQIQFCLDNDKPGRKAVEQLMRKYSSLGYEVSDVHPPEQYKDFNEWLVNQEKKQGDITFVYQKTKKI